MTPRVSVWSDPQYNHFSAVTPLPPLVSLLLWGVVRRVFFLIFSLSLFPSSGTPVSDVTVLARNGGSASVKAPPTHRCPPFGWGAGNPAALPPHIKLKGPGRPSVEYCLHRRFGVVGRRPGKMLNNVFPDNFFSTSPTNPGSSRDGRRYNVFLDNFSTTSPTNPGLSRDGRKYNVFPDNFFHFTHQPWIAHRWSEIQCIPG